MRGTAGPREGFGGPHRTAWGAAEEGLLGRVGVLQRPRAALARRSGLRGEWIVSRASPRFRVPFRKKKTKFVK